MLNRVGQQLGNYRLICLLGRGAFAEVYLGEHIHLDTLAAIKVLHVQIGESELEHFRNEARTIAHLDHPHIVRVLDFGVERDFPFFVMTYAPNGTLRQRHPKGEQLPLTTILHYVKQLADALQYLHEKKLVHRDIKPENMLLGSDGKLLLSDFGIAVVAHTTGSLIIQGQAGTPPYMAPEQILKKPCAASDQYALGVIVYEWMSGNRPFAGSFGEALNHHLNTLPPGLCEHLPTISSAVEAVVLKALTKDPRQRFESVKVFAAALEQALQEEELHFVPPSQQPSSQMLPDVLPSAPPLSANMTASFHHLVPSPDEISLSGQPLVPFNKVFTPNQPLFLSPHTVPAPELPPLSSTTTLSLGQSSQPPVRASEVPESPQQTKKTIPVEPLIQSKEETSTSDKQREIPAILAIAGQSFQQEKVSVTQGRLKPAHPKLSRRTVMLGLGLTGLTLAGVGTTWFLTSSPLRHHTTVESIPIKVGISLPFSGNFSSDAGLTKKGYDLWAADVNRNGGLLGKQVQLIYKNDNSFPDQTRTNYESLITDNHADLLLGPFADEFTVTAGEVAAKHGYALINGTGSAPSTYSQGLHNLLCVSLPSVNGLGNFAKYIQSLPAPERPTTVAYATSDDPFTLPQVYNVKKPLAREGIATVSDNTYPAENTGYDAFAQKIVQSGAQVVVLGTGGVADFTAYIKAFKQQHYNPKMIIGTAGPDGGSDFVNAIGMASTEGLLVPNGAWWPTINTYQNNQFVKNYVAMYGGTPTDISSDAVKAYSAGQVLQQAVTKVNSLDNYLLIAELHSGNTFNTLQGPVKFDDEGHNTTATAYLFQWQKGKLLPVYPGGQAHMKYPKPNWI